MLIPQSLILVKLIQNTVMRKNSIINLYTRLIAENPLFFENFFLVRKNMELFELWFLYYQSVFLPNDSSNARNSEIANKQCSQRASALYRYHSIIRLFRALLPWYPIMQKLAQTPPTILDYHLETVITGCLKEKGMHYLTCDCLSRK